MSGVGNIEVLESLFPGQLSREGKERLRTALAPFQPDPPPPSTDYYLKLEDTPSIFLQGDILAGIRIPVWNAETDSFDKKYTTALLLSNTCDIAADENQRPIDKQVMLAPVINAVSYFQRLSLGFPTAAKSLKSSITQQDISTILYLPSIPGDAKQYPEGFIIELDKVFWFPIKELVRLKDEFLKVRIGSLTTWAHYLLLTKLAFHICRTPEGPDRPAFS